MLSGPPITTPSNVNERLSNVNEPKIILEKRFTVVAHDCHRLSAHTQFFQTRNTTELGSNGLPQALKRLKTCMTSVHRVRGLWHHPSRVVQFSGEHPLGSDNVHTVNRGYFGQILTTNDRHKKLSSLCQLFKVLKSCN